MCSWVFKKSTKKMNLRAFITLCHLLWVLFSKIPTTFISSLLYGLCSNLSYFESTPISASFFFVHNHITTWYVISIVSSHLNTTSIIRQYCALHCGSSNWLAAGIQSALYTNGRMSELILNCWDIWTVEQNDWTDVRDLEWLGWIWPLTMFVCFLICTSIYQWYNI